MKTHTDQESHTSWYRRIFSKPAPPTDAAAEAPAPMPPKKPARNQTVLVVDDDPLFLKLTGTQLEQEGFTVMTAQDGCEAIEIARKQHPNLLVLDVNLPHDVSGVPWNGYRVISWMQRFESMKHIPVVMTSSGDPATITRQALNSGATAFFHKRMNPVAFADLGKSDLAALPTGDQNFGRHRFLGQGSSDLSFERSGGLAGTRTPDQCLKRALLYQLSYQPTNSSASGISLRGYPTSSERLLAVSARDETLVNPAVACKIFSAVYRPGEAKKLNTARICFTSCWAAGDRKIQMAAAAAMYGPYGIRANRSRP